MGGERTCTEGEGFSRVPGWIQGEMGQQLLTLGRAARDASALHLAALWKNKALAMNRHCLQPV